MYSLQDKEMHGKMLYSEDQTTNSRIPKPTCMVHNYGMIHMQTKKESEAPPYVGGDVRKQLIHMHIETVQWSDAIGNANQ